MNREFLGPTVKETLGRMRTTQRRTGFGHLYSVISEAGGIPRLFNKPLILLSGHGGWEDGRGEEVVSKSSL